jgi:hypothetical protein
MDPVRIPESPDPRPVGDSLFIPFEGFDPRVEQGHGTADFNLAVEIPPQKTIHEAKLYLFNTPELVGRIIEYREYGIAEIQKDVAVYAYLTSWKEKGYEF